MLDIFPTVLVLRRAETTIYASELGARGQGVPVEQFLVNEVP
jgi:hypothetical protein